MWGDADRAEWGIGGPGKEERACGSGEVLSEVLLVGEVIWKSTPWQYSREEAPDHESREKA